MARGCWVPVTYLLGSAGFVALGAGGLEGRFGFLLGYSVFRGAIVVVVVFEVAFVVVGNLLARLPHALFRRGSVGRDGDVVLAFGDVHGIGEDVVGVHG